MEYLIAGFGHVLNPVTLIWVAVGVSIGYLLGALPGLGKATGVAVAIPLTFYLDPVSAIAMLIGIEAGAFAFTLALFIFAADIGWGRGLAVSAGFAIAIHIIFIELAGVPMPSTLRLLF